MLGRTHLAFGFLAALFTYSFFKINVFLFFGLVLLGSLIPDIDHPKSKLGKKLGIVSQLFNWMFGHRGFLHSLYFSMIVFIPIYIFAGYEYGLAILIGFLSHIASDGLNFAGINLLHPFPQLKISGFIQTGSILEIDRKSVV